jgi:hypothetical protein
MVEVISGILPKKSNLDIINILTKTKGWNLAEDDSDKENFLYDKLCNNTNMGFILKTVDNKKLLIDSPLNVYAKIIADTIVDKLNLKSVISINWVAFNMYFKNSTTENHTDNTNENFFSALYSLHDTDGGININNIFYKDNESEAKIFNSNILHRGIPPKINNVRFNLNLMFEKRENS